MGDAPVDRFIAHLDEPGASALPAEAVRLIKEAWAHCDGCDGDELLTQGLALISEKFREGLDAYEAEKYEQCVAIMGGLTADADPFLATAAAAYRIKSLDAVERAGEARKAIDELLADGGAKVARHSYFGPELEFLRAYSLVLDLRFEESEKALNEFLTKNAGAPQRLTLAARQMLVELANRAPGGIAEVTDLMGFSGRRLESGDSGDEVQQKQERIVKLLETLIEQAEQQEQNSGNGQGGSGGGGRQPQSPMPDSRLVPGSPEEGRLHAARRAQPGEMWGAMPPAQRERILQALRESFPNRYRQLVEQYYEELAKKP